MKTDKSFDWLVPFYTLIQDKMTQYGFLDKLEN